MSPAMAPMAVVNPKLPKFKSLEQEAEFMMYSFKVALCTRRRRHAWSACPYAHPGETARRRDPRTHCAIPCPEMKSGMVCPRRDRCPYSHHDFEYWLHPTRYRTVMCNRGGECSRVLCFFAHGYEELRLTAANRTSATKPGLADVGEASLADLQPGAADAGGKLQAAGSGELKKCQNSDEGLDDNSSSTPLKQDPSSPATPGSSVLGDLKGDTEPKDTETTASRSAEDKQESGAWVPPTTMLVGRNTSTESLASLKIFSLLANAAKAAKVASLSGGPPRGEPQTSMADPEVCTPRSRPVRHTRSRSLSTAGLDGVYSRVGAAPACTSSGLDFQNNPAGGGGSDLDQGGYLAVSDYPPALERSSSADIATLSQMLQESDLSRPEPLSGCEQTTVTGIPADTSGLPMLPVDMQGGWGMAGECQYPVGMSAPLSQLFYPEPQQDMMFAGPSMLDIEEWQHTAAQLADLSVQDLLAGQDPSMLDLETLQELQNMYLREEGFAEVLRGWGVLDSNILGALGITPTGDAGLGVVASQGLPLSGSTSASCVSEDCALGSVGGQEGDSILQSPAAHK